MIPINSPSVWKSETTPAQEHHLVAKPGTVKPVHGLELPRGLEHFKNKSLPNAAVIQIMDEVCQIGIGQNIPLLKPALNFLGLHTGLYVIVLDRNG